MPSDVSATHVATAVHVASQEQLIAFRRNATRQPQTCGDNRVGDIGEVGEGAVVGKAQPLHLSSHFFQLQAAIVARGPAVRPGLLFQSQREQPSDRMSQASGHERARQV